MAELVTSELSAQVLDAWRIHSRIVLYLLDAVPTESLGDSATKRGRTVAAHLAHIHNVRLMWLKVSAPERMAGLDKVEAGEGTTKEALAAALSGSGEAIAGLLENALETGGRVKSFKPHAAAFMSYLISHEGYHTGKIDLILSLSGHALPDKAHYGIWEWGVR
jgi:uncharacterized damage-inducible protein DinB